MAGGSKVAENVLNAIDGFGRGVRGMASDATWNGKKILKSNEPINKIGEFLLGEVNSKGVNTGIRGTLKNMTGDNAKGFVDAAKDAYTHADGKLNYKAIAGTYVGVSLAGRVASGGGLYRDSNGNVNAPGVPFV